MRAIPVTSSQCGQRYPDVLEQQRPLALDRRNGEPPGRNERLALIRVVGRKHVYRTVFGEHGGHHGGVFGGRAATFIRTSHQHGRRIAVQVHPQGVLDGVDRHRIHELQHRGAKSAGNPEHRIDRRLHRAEAGHHDARCILCGQQSQRHLRDDAQRAFAADEQFGQGKPGDVLEPWAAQPDRGAVGQHNLHAQYVVACDAVLHAAQPAGVGGDVAADAADLERRRIRGIPQAVFGGGLLHLGVVQAGLAHCGAGDRVDGDVAHLFGGQHDPAIQGGRPARKAATGSSGHHGHLVRTGPTQHRLHLFGAPWPDDCQRFAGRRVKGPVLPVAVGDGGVGDHHPLGQLGHQASQHIGIH